jgi:diguanylate cyclase
MWEKMRASMADAIEGLSLTGAEAAQFGDSIIGAASDLGPSSNADDIQKLVAEVVDGARQIQDRTKELEIRLSSTSDEVEQLRENMESERREAGLDTLTGIANRKTFDTSLRKQATTTLENGEVFSLFIVYLDFLKDFNKKHGENIGNQAIKLVANTLQRKLDDTATPARYSGDEFAVILPRSDLEAAAGIANDICDTLSANTIVNKKNETNLGSIIVSIGVSQYEFGEPMTRTISRVGDSLKTAKRKKENKVEVAERPKANQNIAFA